MLQKYKIKKKDTTNCLLYLKTFRVSLSKEQLLRHPALQILKTALIKEVRIKAALAVCGMSSGLIILFFTFEKQVIWSVFALLFWVLGLALAKNITYLWKPNQIPLWSTLQHTPQHIVWVYTLVTQRMPFGFEIVQSGLIYFKLENGEDFSVSVGTKDLKLISRTLNRLLPHASFGYSEEKANIYDLNPKQLIRKRE